MLGRQIKAVLFITIGVSLLTACASESTETDNSDSESEIEATPTTSDQAVISARLARLKSVIVGQIPVIIGPNWDCDADDPKFQEADILKRLNAIKGDCVWSNDPSVIELDLFCGPAADRSCDVKLRSLVESTGAFSSVDLSKMLVTRVLDGLQTSQDGFVSWSITDRGIRLIIDAGGLVESGIFK